MTLGKRIRELREFSGYEMMKYMGITGYPTYKGVENAQNRLSFKHLIMLYRVSGLSASKFLKIIEEEIKEELPPKKFINREYYTSLITPKGMKKHISLNSLIEKKRYSRMSYSEIVDELKSSLNKNHE